jgi:hypothetical protein
MLAILQFQTNYVGPYVRPGIMLLALLGLWLGLGRAKLGGGARVTTWLAVAIVLLIWYVAVDQIGRSGFYRDHPIWIRVGWAVPLVWLAALARSERIAATLAATPTSWLVALQTYRALQGLLLLMLWGLGRAPSITALPTGISDAIVGLLALPIAFYLRSGRPGATSAAIAWNAFGLLELAISFGLGFFVPYSWTYPAVMGIAFIGPLSLLFHALSIWQLTGTAQTSVTERPAMS